MDGASLGSVGVDDKGIRAKLPTENERLQCFQQHLQLIDGHFDVVPVL
jgi:hypothetical protein